MFTELRIYLRLRPYIKQLKEICKMRLSLNLIVQILMTAMQAYNQISDLLPAKWKTPAALVMGIIQGLVALLAHYSNPDGTPATVAYVAPTNKPNGFGLLLLPLLLIIPIQTARAQGDKGPENFVAAGVSWNQYAAPQISGNLLYARRLTDTDSTYSWTFVDVLSKSINPFSTSTSLTTGIGQKLLVIGPAKIYGTTGVGIMAGGTNVGYSWSAGGAAFFGIGKGWAVAPTVRVIKSSLTDFQGIYGILIGWGK